VRYYRNHSLDGATLFSKLDSNKLRFNVKNEMTLICAELDADLINISKVKSRKTKWPRLFDLYPVYTCYSVIDENRDQIPAPPGGHSMQQSKQSCSVQPLQYDTGQLMSKMLQLHASASSTTAANQT